MYAMLNRIKQKTGKCTNKRIADAIYPVEEGQKSVKHLRQPMAPMSKKIIAKKMQAPNKGPSGGAEKYPDKAERGPLFLAATAVDPRIVFMGQTHHIRVAVAWPRYCKVT